MGPGKEALVVSRLTRKLSEAGCGNFEDYVKLAARDENTLAGMVDALTTNYTAFLREIAHFDFLRETILPALSARPSFTIWCAAAATGEEPYSLAFNILEALGAGAKAQAGILATDISVRALDRARRAVYPESAFAAVPEPWLSKYLLRGEGKNQGHYQVKPAVASMVTLRQLNLIQEFEHPTRFPLISCRNVMIYFDRPTQGAVVKKLTRYLEPGGYLFVGHSESLTGIDHSLQFVKPAIYRKPFEPESKGARG
jgi:chemotaxis protein methyltransferase CheR